MEYKIVEKSDLDSLINGDTVYVFFKKTGEYKPYEFVGKEEENGVPYLIKLVTHGDDNEMPMTLNEQGQVRIHTLTSGWTFLYIRKQNGGRRKNRGATKKGRKNRRATKKARKNQTRSSKRK